MRQPQFGIFLISLTILLSGCDEFQPSKPQPPTVNENRVQESKVKDSKVKESRVPVRRFILTKFDSGVAFDTQTGQLCKTWEWQPVGKEVPADANGNHPQRMVGEFTPTCLSLYRQYPSGTGITSENLPDE